MRELPVSNLTEAIRNAFIEANYTLPEGIRRAVIRAKDRETSPVCQAALQSNIDNWETAYRESLPVCQDTGIAVLFLEIGQDVHFVNGDFREAVEEGVRRAYTEGYLRCSVVQDPLRRKNTGDNTPPILHVTITAGDRVRIIAAPKGFGSENMSALRMFTPAATKEEIEDFVAETAIRAGSNPCPPILVGVGIGGDFEYCACLAKKALLRDPMTDNSDPFYREMEQTITQKINAAGIGAQGFGGTQTVLGVHIEPFPTHIAGLPVAVNIGCHATRHITVIL